MFHLLVTALFVAASAAEFSTNNARALLDGKKKGYNDYCYGYGQQCYKNDDCCGCLECVYDYCGKPCGRKGDFCEDYYDCCKDLYCYGYECVDYEPCYPIYEYCRKDDDCCGALKCVYDYCDVPCKKEKEFCDNHYHKCCDGFYCEDYCCKKGHDHHYRDGHNKKYDDHDQHDHRGKKRGDHYGGKH